MLALVEWHRIPSVTPTIKKINDYGLVLPRNNLIVQELHENNHEKVFYFFLRHN